ncbi:hypothetical protein STEG23_017734 [Scotinomys teguina]
MSFMAPAAAAPNPIFFSSPWYFIDFVSIFTNSYREELKQVLSRTIPTLIVDSLLTWELTLLVFPIPFQTAPVSLIGLKPRVCSRPDPPLLSTSEVSCFTQIPLFPVRFIRLAPLLTTVLYSYHSRQSPYGTCFPVRATSCAAPRPRPAGILLWQLTRSFIGYSFFMHSGSSRFSLSRFSFFSSSVSLFFSPRFSFRFSFSQSPCSSF